MRFATLDEWLAWLEQCHPTEIDLGLERTLLVAKKMGVLNTGNKTITVAGTNGKGSCVATISALLQATGSVVGTYTSPHLQHYSERICINSVPVSADELCQAFALVDDARGATSLTYFEFGTLAALAIFKQYNTNINVLEVGLGGRLDAVNIIDADVAVVTGIAIDHEAWLGDNREAIGFEKAGIFRSNKPAICGDPSPPQSLLNAAKTMQVNLQRFGVDFSFGLHEVKEGLGQNVGTWWFKDINASGGELYYNDLPKVGLPLQSVVAGMQAVHSLKVDITAELLREILPKLSLPGRMQRVTYKQRNFLLDVAHNPQATAYLASQIPSSVKPCGRVFAIVAMMQDKDRQGNLSPIIEVVDVWCLAELSNLPRAADCNILAQDLAVFQKAPERKGSIENCINWCITHANEQDLILIFGSFFTVSEALAILEEPV